MGAVDDALFELKLALDRTLGGLFSRGKKHGHARYCPACGTANSEGASRCSKCYRSFELYNRP